MENKSIRTTRKAGHQDGGRGVALFYLALSVCYTAGIYWLSSIPGNIDPEEAGIYWIISWTPATLQNLLHIPLFGILAWLWYRTLDVWNMQHGAALTSTFIAGAAFGIVDEWHQLHVPGRYASFTDIALNCAGIILALWWIHSCKRRSNHPNSGSRLGG